MRLALLAVLSALKIVLINIFLTSQNRKPYYKPLISKTSLQELSRYSNIRPIYGLAVPRVATHWPYPN